MPIATAETLPSAGASNRGNLRSKSNNAGNNRTKVYVKKTKLY